MRWILASVSLLLLFAGSNAILKEMGITIKKIDYENSRQAQDLVNLLNAYTEDPMGGGEALSDDVKTNLCQRLAKVPSAFTLIAYDESETPAGLVNCFEGFSTFAGRPLVNIHDMYVADAFRGRGISQALLAAAEDEARARGCCKMTLECLSKNEVALKAYKKSGYGNYELDPTHGVAMMFEKKLK